jgi:hypothetical protein
VTAGTANGRRSRHLRYRGSCVEARGQAHLPGFFPPPVDAMRLLFALVLVSPLVSGCTPYLPMKQDFGTSAAVTKGDIPPEYAGFNAYDPNLNSVLANQICATTYQPGDVAVSDASPGQLVTAHGTCAPHMPIIGN